MSITDHPLHRSGRAALPHPAPTLGNDAQASEGIRVTNVGWRKPTSDQSRHAFPIQPLPLTSPPKREVPVTANLEPKELDRRAVSGDSVVAREATDHRAKPLSLLGNRHVHTLSQFGFDLLKFPAQPLASRLANDRVHAVTSLRPADMRESQEVECFRSPLMTPLAVIDREWTEFHEPRLFRVQRQTELSESLLEFSQTPFRFGLVLKSNHEVIRPPDDDHIALSLRTPPMVDPQIEDVMQEDVRQQRGNHSALRRPFIDGLPSTLLHHAGSQPFLDEPQDARITNAVLDELYKPSVIERVEGNSHTLPITRNFLQASPSLDPIMPLKVSLLLFRGEFIGKVEHTFC